MSDKNAYANLKEVLKYIEDEINKPINNYNYETRIWSRGYRKAMITIRDLIWEVFNKEN